jgi:hypothetical protein
MVVSRAPLEVRRLTSHLVTEELYDLVASLTGDHDGDYVNPVVAELVRETARSLDRFIRQGRLPAGRTCTASAPSLPSPAPRATRRTNWSPWRGLRRARAGPLAGQHPQSGHPLRRPRRDAAPAIETAAELVPEVTRLFTRKVPGQLRIGPAIATSTHQRVLVTA